MSCLNVFACVCVSVYLFIYIHFICGPRQTVSIFGACVVYVCVRVCAHVYMNSHTYNSFMALEKRCPFSMYVLYTYIHAHTHIQHMHHFLMYVLYVLYMCVSVYVRVRIWIHIHTIHLWPYRKRVCACKCACVYEFIYTYISYMAPRNTSQIHNSFHWKRYTPKIHHVQRLNFLGTNSHSTQKKNSYSKRFCSKSAMSRDSTSSVQIHIQMIKNKSHSKRFRSKSTMSRERTFSVQGGEDP